MSKVGKNLRRRRTMLVVGASVVVTAAAAAVGQPTSGDIVGIPRAYAALCQAANTVCNPPDLTRTSALTVDHHTSPQYAGTSTVVQPNTGEAWAATVTWCPLVDGTPVVTVTTFDVDWNGSSWVLSNTVLGGGVNAVNICQGETCDAGGGSVHSWSYKVYLDIVDPAVPGDENLKKVTYTTTSVDNGRLVMDPTQTQGYCYLGSAVSPTTQTFTAIDELPYWDSNRCPYNCNTGGASVTLYYQ